MAVTTTTWPLKKLKDITSKIGSGATPRGGKNGYRAEGISLIRSLNVYDFSFIEEDLAFIGDEQAAELDNVIVQKDDILLNITGASVARCCLTNPKFMPARVNQHVAIVRVCPEVADARFVLYCINSLHFKSRLLALAQGGATREALTKTTIEDFEVCQPPLLVQRRIAGILSAYDELMENSQRRIRILEAMARSLYREWFVHFRFPGLEKLPRVASALGDIPQGWEVRTVKDVAAVTYGFPFASKKFNTDGIGTPVIRIRDILDGSINTFTDEEAEPKYHIKNGDILVGMDGEFHMCIWSSGQALQNQRVAKFESNGEIGNYHLFLALELPIQTWNKSIVGTTVAHLGDLHIKTIHIAWPPVKILSKAKEILEPMSHQIIALKRQIQNLRRTRDLLLPRLLSGQLEIGNN